VLFLYVCECGSKHLSDICLVYLLGLCFEAYVEPERKKLLLCFQLLLGVFFSIRSVALIDDLPKMDEGKGYKSSARFVVKYVEHIGYLLHDS